MIDEKPTSPKAGPRRLRRTRLRVRLADYAAWWIITLGGLGTIAAVLLVCVFLVWVVVPLFTAPRFGGATTAKHSPVEPPLRLALDEGQTLGWNLTPSGQLESFQLTTGELIESVSLFEGSTPTAAAFAPGENGGAAFGFSDGTVRLVRISIETEQLTDDAATRFQKLAPGTQVVHEASLVLAGAKGTAIRERVTSKVEDPVAGATPSPIVKLDFTVRGENPIIATLNADGRLAMREVRKRKNIMTGKVSQQVNEAGLDLPPSTRGVPQLVRMTGLGDNVYLIWKDGSVARYDTRDYSRLQLAEELDVLPEAPQAEVTCAEWLIGRTSLAIGDSIGQTRIWFRVKPETGEFADGTKLVMAHTLQGPAGQAVTALATSSRTRVLAAGYAGGSVRLFQVTANRLLSDIPPLTRDGTKVVAAAIAPKEDGLAVATSGGLTRWHLDLMHPEAGVAAYFKPIWYEGYTHPQHVWQSSSGTDDFEPKLGLWPLIYGTIKATFYSMIFGMPLALLAAIYCSEFLHPRAKARVKPAIEMMASLPSVVLGFLAALVFAPFAEEFIPEVLTAFITMPLALFSGAFVWQLLPRQVHLRLGGGRLGLIAVAFLGGALGARILAPFLEAVLFAGDIKMWLSGHAGSSWGGWFYLTLPLSAISTAWAFFRLGEPVMRRLYERLPMNRVGLLELARFALGVVTVFALSAIVAEVLSVAGFDPRGSLVGTYVQRNALVVGFVMGFAIIPIIYTIAEDALATVPSHLRSASLAAGATPWQTAVRVIIPTAMSGLFSAIMIGLGRAVGETMIVLMAAGNTPVMEWNVFSGFRTLSANIAVELPEAVRNSTHYRTLFLAALSLFVLTFILNTFAELVRRRFRRKAVQM